MAVKRKDAPVRDLRSALEFLRGMQGQLVETEVEVDPAAELSGVYRYVGAGGTVKRPTRTNGPAMLFKNLKGHHGASAAIGVLASRERVARLLGCAKEDLGRLLCESVASPIAPVLDEPPAPCQEVVHLASEPDFDLFRLLPAPTNTPVDAGPYTTLGMCCATHPDTGCSDVTIHRLCIQGRDELSIFLQPGSRHIGAMAERAEELGRPLPISVSIGVDPAIEIGACFEPPTTPLGYDELSIAGAIRGEPVRLCRCVSVAERAIAHAEFVIEGEIVPGVRVQEDQHSGTGFAMPEFPGYNGVASSECWLLKVKALTHRRAPILQTCIGPSEEHVNMAGIASGYSENLLLRAADVTLKEGRKLVLAVREAPLSAVHLRNMYELARFGAVVFPPVPAWYAKPQSLEEAERQIAARILAQFGVEAPGAPCWG